uniref:Putative Cephalosporin hydroxylase (Methyl transferase like) n=1 Tax=Magnetococcus massalia (strain MO-1) TaxID=451514 RepID=A0A1S7LKF3_MAGMO|nr:Putative Cephalosporin hydroxylase (methyl transferase like) [Candidatus Magnetococcus massalia]
MIHIDTEKGLVTLEERGERRTLPMSDPEAFAAVSRAYLRAGWDLKYVYSFTWMGRPIIQLPDDMVRMQEVIYQVKPDLIIETGVAHGGSLIFYAGLCKAMGQGRVVGVDIEIRPHNRAAIEAHEMFPLITLIEGDSIAERTVAQVAEQIKPNESVMVLLDGKHTYDHVMAELELYGALITPGSYIVAMDGIMQDLAGAPRSQSDWAENNPAAAARDFAARHSEFELVEPAITFNEGALKARTVTYWPDAFLRKL